MGGAIALALSAALAAAVLAPAAAQASGFLVYEMSGEGMAKGSAVAADATEPTALWYNPGSMVFLPPASFQVGVLSAVGFGKFEPAAGSQTENASPDVYWLPRMFADVQVTDWLHAGLGVYSIYGLGIAWEDDWVGREDGISAEMATLSLNPALSVRLHERVGLGAGFVAMKGSADLTSGLPQAVGGKVRFGGEDWAFGAHAGMTVKAIPDLLDVGLAWHGRMTLTLDGKADFDPSPEFARDLTDQGASADITMPDIFTAGVALNLSPSLRLSTDWNVILWDVYDETVLKLDDGTEQVTVHDYEPSFIARLGIDWKTSFVDGMALRGGFIYDQSPAPDGRISPTLPDAEKLDFTLGVGQRIGWLKADLGYMLMIYLPNEQKGNPNSPDGTYSSIGHMVALTVGAVID